MDTPAESIKEKIMMTLLSVNLVKNVDSADGEREFLDAGVEIVLKSHGVTRR
jgi:hypothetical protein